MKEFFKCEPSGRMTGDARREQILQTAVTLFSQRGFKGTTTKEIARAAGVSEAMVFRHFENKDALYGAILDTKGCQDGVHTFPWEGNRELLTRRWSRTMISPSSTTSRLTSLDKHQTDDALHAAAFLLRARGA